MNNLEDWGIDRLIKEGGVMVLNPKEVNKMINTVTNLKRECILKGYNWFDSGNTRFFKSRYRSKIYKEKYFITSEQFLDNPRLYSIRVFEITDGKICIDTVGEFQGFESYNEAKSYIKNNL